MDATSKFKDTLPTTPEKLLALLDSLEIAYVVHWHPPLRTVEDPKAHRDNMPVVAHKEPLSSRSEKTEFSSRG